MASCKEPQSNRPQSSHRLSISSTTSSNVPVRHTISRHHSHSVSLGAANPSHRVTRRKSMNANATNTVAAIAAALKDRNEKGVTSSKRGSLNSKIAATSRGLESSRYGTSVGDTYNLGGVPGTKGKENEEAMDDGEFVVEDDFLMTGNASTGSSARARRASEGSYLTKGESKRSSGELRCDKCGKGYKHSSCLTKHLWEHTPEWTYTSKLLISKHQQVQLLQAASVLVGMNQDAMVAEDATKPLESDHSSASPAASGSSDVREEEYYYISSAETTPPPMSDHYSMVEDAENSRSKRYSGNSSSFSRSYQSAPSFSLPGGNNPGHSQQQRRPSSSGLAPADVDEDEAGLVAAVESLCSFGNSRQGLVQLPGDVPPVPPVPAIYRSTANKIPGGLGQAPEIGLSLRSYQVLSDERDVKMDNRHIVHNCDDYDDDDRPISHGGNDEEDDDIFGVMEGVSHERFPGA